MGYVIAFLVLLGIAITIVECLWVVLKAIVSAVWLPALLFFFLIILWCFLK